MKTSPGKQSRLAITFFAVAVPLFLSSCESALSDIEITDPSVLQTHFVVERSLLSDGTVTHSLTTTLFDKNLASVELKNGKVKVNNQTMAMAEILNITTYHVPSAAVNLDTEYKFEVVLANGQSYPGTVKSQAKAFTSVTAPATASASNDLTISWQDVYVHDAMIITVNVTSPTTTVEGGRYELTAAQMQSGSFVIPKSVFSSTPGATSALITITGAKYGTIDSKFMTGSSTISRMRIEKKVTLN